ncbi:MAG: hypothetical protein ACFFDN_01045 [Candidatus Hodarchaeota archaeon]
MSKNNDKDLNEKVQAFQYGHFLFEQYGKLVKIKNLLRPKEHKEYIEELVSKRPEIKEKINQDINQLREIVETYNPNHLLHSICTKFFFYNPISHKESNQEGLEIYYEYALSLISSVKCKSPENLPNNDTLEEFKNLIINVINLVIQYYMTENLNGRDDLNKQLRFTSILNYIAIRGDSYQSHHKELVLNLFKPHNDVLISQIGYTIEDILEFIESMNKQINTYLKPYEGYSKIELEFQKLLVAFIISKEKSDYKQLSEDEKQEFANTPEFLALRKKSDDFFRSLEAFFFKIVPNEKIPKRFLDQFCLKPGENSIFAEGTAFWPLNDSEIYYKPILKINNEYFGFGLKVFFRNLINILEAIIRDSNKKYFNDRYLKAKGNYLERTTLKYLKKLIPESKSHQNLYYYLEENGDFKRYETDGLILYDTNLFIIESKALKYTISARRGSILRIERTLKKFIDEAYSQALRCKNYIMNNNPAVFEDKSGKKILINNHDFTAIFLINTTFERLRRLSTELYNFKRYGLIQGKEWPWSIFINDLRIISEILDFPSVFLLFLKRRIRSNELELIKTQDEIDIFMFFLKQGLYFESGEWKDIKHLSLGNYCDSLDKYYLFKDNLIPEAERPRFNIPLSFEKIVKKIENTKKKGFTIATTNLLDVDSKDMKLFLELIERFKKKSFETGEDYKMFFKYKKEKKGIMFVIRTDIKKKSWDGFIEFLELMKYKFKHDLSIMIMGIFDGINETWDFKIIQQKWKFNATMYRKVKKLKFNGMKIVKG